MEEPRPQIGGATTRAGPPTYTEKREKAVGRRIKVILKVKFKLTRGAAR